MSSDREIFDISGPLHLKAIDWTNSDHRRSVVASLVQGVYILERDRQENRRGSHAFAPPWWEFLNFQVERQLVDNVDSCIFGAIFKFNLTESSCRDSINASPKYVIAFRGTITKGDAFSRDLELDFHFIQNGLHQTLRFERAMQAVRNMVATFGESSIWLAGHSLGSAMAMLAGKNMAKTGIFLDSYLFNPPFISAPIERIKNKNVKNGIRIAGSVITAGLAIAMSGKKQNNRSGAPDPFIALSAWVPCLFVNAGDHICSEYIGYFEHRKNMEDIGAGSIERLATRHSMGGLFMSVMGKDYSGEPLHLIPSASLTVNLTPSRDFREAHGIHQWWRSDLRLDSKVYRYE